MRILVIDNYDSFTFNLVQLLTECEVGDFDVLKNDELNLDGVIEYDKILISPGPGIPSEAGKICEVIQRYASAKPILGVCLGHQAIAEAFGGKLIRLEIPSHGVKKKIEVADSNDILFRGLPEVIEGGLYHSWAVSLERLPLSLLVTASAMDGTVMAIRHSQYPVFGVQFHLESVMTPHGPDILRNWLALEKC